MFFKMIGCVFTRRKSFTAVKQTELLTHISPLLPSFGVFRLMRTTLHFPLPTICRVAVIKYHAPILIGHDVEIPHAGRAPNLKRAVNVVRRIATRYLNGSITLKISCEGTNYDRLQFL